MLSITDGVTAGNSQTLGYDALNRLTSAAGGYGSCRLHLRQRRQPDDAKAWAARPDLRLYGEEQPDSLAVTATARQQAIGYDKGGQRQQLQSAAGAITQSPSTTRPGRLATAMAGSTPSRNTPTTPSGSGVAEQARSTGTTLYQYDPSGHLLEETDGQGNPQVDYIYLGALPVATISPANGSGVFPAQRPARHAASATDSGQNVAWSPITDLSAR